MPHRISRKSSISKPRRSTDSGVQSSCCATAISLYDPVSYPTPLGSCRLALKARFEKWELRGLEQATRLPSEFSRDFRSCSVLLSNVGHSPLRGSWGRLLPLAPVPQVVVARPAGSG